jgi:phosphoglycolate phosphatase-like HAD superfamily hydrolase
LAEYSVTRFDLVIFDCDGVLVDSELISNRAWLWSKTRQPASLPGPRQA